jgi:hypothetical protein
MVLEIQAPDYSLPRSRPDIGNKLAATGKEKYATGSMKYKNNS